MAYPEVTPGASLLLSFRLRRQTVLIIGSNTLAASRAFAALEADSQVVILAKGGQDNACDELRWRADQGQLSIVDLDAMPCGSESTLDRGAQVLQDYLAASNSVRLVIVADTVIELDRRTQKSAEDIAQVCRSRNIPVNITDMPDLCDFSFTSTHRFTNSTMSQPTPLQIGITTNGQGCRLASRLRRDIVAKLPKDVGTAVTRVGKLRSLAKASNETLDTEADGEVNEEAGPSTPNRPVAQRTASENALEAARRRMKWAAQVSEYWPIHKLARMTEDDMTAVLDGRTGLSQSQLFLDDTTKSLHGLPVPHSARTGRIYLVGSGPGHPSLLTRATHVALTKHADLVLSDKLVPAAVLELVPPEVEVRIARKFPGNADGAQAELMEAAIDAAKRGLTVVRLKQGDPSVYGRAGEEILYFREHGFEPIVIPGVSSVLAGPTFAGIPVTQRGAAESFVVCTGVGRQGKEVVLPGYERSRTLVILMGVARLLQMLETLLAESGEPTTRRKGAAYPAFTPIAIIERASMPDQRVIFSTLRDIAVALDSAGEQRPPGMIVVGWSVLCLWGKGDVSVLDGMGDEEDEARVRRWLDGQRWRNREGLDEGWNEL